MIRGEPAMVCALSEIKIDLEEANKQLRAGSPEERMTWAFERFGRGLVLSTSFGMYSAVMLHLASRVLPELTVLFVDSGFLTPETYRFKKELVERLGLRVRSFIPARTRAELEALDGPLAELLASDNGRKELAGEIKVEPFERGLKELEARAWMSGVLRGETEQRREFHYLMQRSDGLYKVHPILDWNSKRCYAYLKQHGLPINEHYLDICKSGQTECGIHLTGLNLSLTASEL
ncbi:MAG: hypothetical protein A3F83_02375 [Candidatus Glassbacteria bacterium RIFCSPLOWO2_12_FULL_58_11]|uniref:Phosphoadenosine phosphosulphate reductase domain-containing protein n=1 Tax=Candidatus Glassbacteria bacterium RIFCSPLOWO2_12_FULL_58_11 TaxID=1817867 RepID=A0A1F5YLM7_9BACT|nr:MAG: hypothetical protein A3F83_02375 [Candidatus Glassbacteria bacterium RIFCSPLOWO2_12_FULL_58_11]